MSRSREIERDDPDISPAEILDHVWTLAEERLGGRPSGDWRHEAAAAYVAGELARAGLLPAGDHGTYLQAFELQGPVQRVRAPVLEVESGAAVDPAELTPAVMSAAGSAEGTLRPVGFGLVDAGTETDDLAEIELEGAVALAFLGAPPDAGEELRAASELRSKAGAVQDRGAVALLVVNPRPRATDAPGDPRLPWLPRAGRIAQSIPVLQVSRTAAAGLLGYTLAELDTYEESLHSATAAAAPPPRAPRVRVDAAVARAQMIAHNVVAWLPAGAPPADGVLPVDEQIVIVGAHLDHLGLGEEGGADPAQVGHVHPGADDNASGVAGLIEIAEQLAARERRDPRLRRPVLFAAFAGEELGLLGSRHLAASLPGLAERGVAMLNMDMIGRGDDGVLVVGGVDTGDYLRALATEMAEGRGLELKLTGSGYGPSDHDSFTRAGVPVLFLFTGLHGDYHKVTDTADRIEADGAARIASFCADLTRWLATTRVPPTYVKLPEPSAGEGRGYGPYLGTRPSFEDHPEGLAIEGVAEGSPAEKAGILPGDVVLWFERTRVNNIYDYTRAMRATSAGDTVTLVVKRGDEEVIVTPTLVERGQ